MGSLVSFLKVKSNKKHTAFQCFIGIITQVNNNVLFIYAIIHIVHDIDNEALTVKMIDKN